MAPVTDLGFSLRENLIKSRQLPVNVTGPENTQNKRDQDNDGDDTIFSHLCQSKPKQYEFLPISSLELLFNLEGTKKIIAEAFPGENHQDLCQEICGNGYRQSRIRIMAVLCQMERPQLLKSFLEHKVFDDSLPLDTQLNGFGWKLKDLVNWRDKQYKAIAPFFHLNTKNPEHYRLDSNVQIPFLSRRARGNGAHGAVSEVCLHKDHYFCEESKDFDLTGPYFSLKEFNRGMTTEYLNERKGLERFSGSNSGHPHLIRLLMSYEYDGRYFMIFPLAEYDMLDFWKVVSNNPTSPKFLNWVLTQCHGLAQGLQNIHNYDAKLKDGSNKHKGRHGDIKPRNILCFDSPGKDSTDGDVTRYRLVLADFTFMRFHSPLSCDHSTESTMRYTRTYRPPETCSDKVSQKHDVWTLGCVYLEFITWHLLGHEAIDEKFSIKKDGPKLQGFRTLRTLEDPVDDRIAKDTFFKLDTNGKAHLKESVPKCQWCSYLRGRESCSTQLLDFINFIQEHMLVVELDKRKDIDFICEKLDTILNDKDLAHIRLVEDQPTEKVPANGILKGNRISESSNDMPTENVDIAIDNNPTNDKSIEQPAVPTKLLMSDQETYLESSASGLDITQAKENEKHSAENSNIAFENNATDDKSIEQPFVSKGLLVPGKQPSMKPSSSGSLRSTLHSTQVEDNEKLSAEPNRPLNSNKPSTKRACQSSSDETRRNWIARKLYTPKKHVKKWWFKFKEFKVSIERGQF
ncbi:unnamed protein product, partial [Clonostachys byssicola]